MADGFSVTVEGADDLIAKLRSLGGDVGEAVDKGIVQGAHRVQAAAKRLCPVNNGELRNSIVVTHPKSGEAHIVVQSEHGIYVEFGTGSKGDPSVAHTTKPCWWVHESMIDPADAERYHLVKWESEDAGTFYRMLPQAPQPFFDPALQQSKEAVKDSIMRAIRKAIAERSV